MIHPPVKPYVPLRIDRDPSKAAPPLSPLQVHQDRLARQKQRPLDAEEIARLYPEDKPMPDPLTQAEIEKLERRAEDCMEFTAVSRETALALLAEVKRHRARYEKLEAVVDAIRVDLNCSFDDEAIAQDRRKELYKALAALDKQEDGHG